MNARLTYILFFIVSIVTALAEEKKIPDLSKAFPTEELFGQTRHTDREVYHFKTKIPYSQLRKLLLKYLGEGWKVHPLSKNKKEMLREHWRKQQISFTGKDLYKNSKLPDVTLSLSQIRAIGEGIQPTTQILLIRK